jgi:hypothetical protein
MRVVALWLDCATGVLGNTLKGSGTPREDLPRELHPSAAESDSNTSRFISGSRVERRT